ncbi:unnamed protein product, partial [Polarella glacialis]
MVAPGESDEGSVQKRQRVSSESPWPAWGSGAAELAEGSGEAALQINVLVMDASSPAAAASSPAVIASGIAYLDHMVDQLTSHAQLKISLQVSLGGRQLQPHSNEAHTLGVDRNVASLAGAALGSAMADLLAVGDPERIGRRSAGGSFCFCAPLDEAFTELHLDFPKAGAPEPGNAEVSLAPYGIFPKAGRQCIGSFRTALTDVFLKEFAGALKCGLRARKVRGDNAHHVVEATFKSLARCLRKAMDEFCGFLPNCVAATLSYRRHSRMQRSTKETSIDVEVDLDPVAGLGLGAISTGIATLDGLLREIQEQSGIHMRILVSGDLWIDDHHSSEDVMITVGKALNEALGDKGGINRMGCAEGEVGGAK